MFTRKEPIMTRTPEQILADLYARYGCVQVDIKFVHPTWDHRPTERYVRKCFDTWDEAESFMHYMTDTYHVMSIEACEAIRY